MSKKTMLLEQLTAMKGKDYQYGNTVHLVKDVIIDEESEKFSIVTDVNKYDRKFEAGIEFLRYWSPVNEPKQLQIINSKDNALADEMIKILQDNITRVQTDAKYIEQAKSINNNVNSIINIVKTKLDFAKALRSKN